MTHATYFLTGDERIPAKVAVNGYSSPVWIQQKWEDGEYARYIQRNGCGHSCTAMALNLNGIKITPYEEFMLCRQRWGNPRTEEPYNEDNFISASGIVKIINSFDVAAQCFGVAMGKSYEAAKHIEDMLLNGKQVIFWSHPSEKLANNPFSKGEHYVLAVGICENGKILIANSSLRGTAKNGIQLVELGTIAKALYEGCEPYDFTWGRYPLENSGGYVVAG